MVLHPDQQRVCLMLKDTITLLCKNGLTFKSKFSVEAVIGVTIDDDQMFHISMNEIVKSVTAEQFPDESSSDESSSRRRRKRKKRIKTEGDRSDSSDVGSESESERNGQTHPAKRIDIKGEPEEEEDDNSGDIVFVKQERDDSWSQACSQQQDFSNFSQVATSQQQDHNFSSLSDLDLTPVTAPNDSNLWATNMQMQQQQYNSPMSMGRMPRPATSVTGASPMRSPGQATASGEQSQVVGDYRLTCRLCSKTYADTRGLKRHEMAAHYGRYPHACQICGQGFMTKDNLKGHMSKHTSEKPYECETCKERFKWKAMLLTHVKRFHSVDVPDKSGDANSSSGVAWTRESEGQT